MGPWDSLGLHQNVIFPIANSPRKAEPAIRDCAYMVYWEGNPREQNWRKEGEEEKPI